MLSFYGAQAWVLSDKNVGQFQTMWNRCVRRILDLPDTTHRILLPGLVHRLSAIEQIYCRFVKMAKMMLESENVKVKFLVRKALLDSNSIINTNVSVIAKAAGCDRSEVLLSQVCEIKRCLHKKYTEVDSIVNQIDELLYAQSANVFSLGLTPDEIRDILTELCTN